jgi:mannose-6-phosphate isomerase-like protein (cupin superfamily)
MEGIKIFKLDEVESRPLPGLSSKSEKKEGWVKRVVHYPNVETKGVFMHILEVNPGFSSHRWHTHTTDQAEGYKVVYPKDFVEIYHVVSGGGAVQWKTKDGHIEERQVSAGDTLYFPVNVGEHQLLNNGDEKLLLVVCGGPTPEVTYSK